MAEYIEREAFIQDIQTEIINLSMDGMKGTRMPHDELYSFIDRIKEQPAADVVPVVRCKDCKYFTKGPYVFDNSKCWCACWYDSVKDDDFCSYGAKKDLEDKS